jgi:hypothetical protein
MDDLQRRLGQAELKPRIDGLGALEALDLNVIGHPPLPHLLLRQVRLLAGLDVEVLAEGLIRHGGVVHALQVLLGGCPGQAHGPAGPLLLLPSLVLALLVRALQPKADPNPLAPVLPGLEGPGLRALALGVRRVPQGEDLVVHLHHEGVQRVVALLHLHGVGGPRLAWLVGGHRP